MYCGMSVSGPQTQRSAPMVARPHMLERATRECRISPTMATLRPLSAPQRSRMVSMSSRACVGCSFEPSPALMMTALVHSVRYFGTPADWCRTTTMSIFIASMFLMVSLSVSPFLTLDPAEEKLTVSPESLFSASSKLMRVRVLFSKKRLTRVGPFLMSRDSTSWKPLAVSRMRVMSSFGTLRRPSRCLIVSDMGPPCGWVLFFQFNHPDAVVRVFFRHLHLDFLIFRRGHGFADVVRVYGKFAQAAVDEHRELDSLGPAKVGECVEGRARGAAGIEHVIDQNDVFPLYGEADVGRLHRGLFERAAVIVPVKRNIKRAHGYGAAVHLLDFFRQASGNNGAPGLHTHDNQVLRAFIPLKDLVRHAVDYQAHCPGVEDGRFLFCLHGLPPFPIPSRSM